MMTVRIIGGGYGMNGGATLVRTGETVRVDDAEGRRLVRLGVAVQTGEPAAPAEESVTSAEEKEPELDSMSRAELRALAKERGLKYSATDSREALLDMLNTAPVLSTEGDIVL